MTTVTIDETTRTGKRLLNEIKKCRTGVTIKSPAVDGVAPKGYMTSGDFRIKAHEKLDDFCKKNGIL